MRFINPWFLILILFLPFLMWLRKKLILEPAFLYSSVQLVKWVTALRRSRSGMFLRILRFLVLLLLIIAIARPQLGEGKQTIKASGIDIVVALDLSGSMASEDFVLKNIRVNRLTMAKDVLRRFIEKRPADRFGLVVFAGRAYLACPLTLDHDFLLQQLDRLDIGIIEDSTAIGAGISTALNRLRVVQSRSKIIILLTDGQNNAGRITPITAAEAAAALGVKIYCIGVGTRGAAPYPTKDQFGRKYYVQVKVDIDENTLQEVSKKTGGKYFRADNTKVLEKIFDEIDTMEKTEAIISKYQTYKDLYIWPLTAALICMLLEIVLGQTIFRKLP